MNDIPTHTEMGSDLRDTHPDGQPCHNFAPLHLRQGLPHRWGRTSTLHWHSPYTVHQCLGGLPPEILSRPPLHVLHIGMSHIPTTRSQSKPFSGFWNQMIPRVPTTQCHYTVEHGRQWRTLEASRQTVSVRSP